MEPEVLTCFYHFRVLAYKNISSLQYSIKTYLSFLKGTLCKICTLI